MKSNEIMDAINNSSLSYEKLYNNCEEHNIKYSMISTLIKCGIGIDYIIPFVTSSLVALLAFSKLDRSPFTKTDIREYASKYTMTTSSGYCKILESYDIEYKNNSIEYSTKWVLNDKNLYERDVIIYRYNKSDKNIDEVLKMTKEEISNLYTICNYKKIQKEKLEEEDKIYNEDVVILNKVINDEVYRIRKETSEEELLEILIFILFILTGSKLLSKVKNVILKETISDKLKRVQKNYRPINSNELRCAKKILEIRKENIDLINDGKSRGI